MRDTDASGALYFANQLEIALEAFETAIAAGGFSLREVFCKENFLLPVVHAEADFFAPVYLGDALDITLETARIGTTSFTSSTIFFKEGVRVGSASITHVAVSKESNSSIPIPEIIINKINFN